ncbi:MAG: hypothetical protein GX601_10465 [Anaerolineales bacterium]|nr:hypothetical protein [Anaerolineales bacterium]
MPANLFDLTGKVAVVTGAALPVDGGNLALNASVSHTWPIDLGSGQAAFLQSRQRATITVWTGTRRQGALAPWLAAMAWTTNEVRWN